MWQFFQTIILGIALILALGFLIYRLSARSKALALNKSTCCHGETEADTPPSDGQGCSHCSAEGIR